MNSQNIERCIIRYLSGLATKKELEGLDRWLRQSDKPDTLLSSLVNLNYVIKFSMSTYDKEKSKRDLLDKISRDKAALQRLSIRNYLRYAAIITLVAVTAFVVMHHLNSSKANIQEIPTEGQITLRLDDGSLKLISETENRSINDHKGNKLALQSGSFIKYANTFPASQNRYNTLSVPNGKMFNLILSDGTAVTLNSGSSITYPVSFGQGVSREVFLNGEAYFDVTPDTNNPFIVNANNLNVRVLGTKFIVTSYIEEKNIKTVLMEGSVGLYKGGEKFNEKTSPILKPGDLATWNKNDVAMKIEEVDPALYSAWMNGKLVFQHMEFADILRRLERHYNVEIINNNSDLDKEVFTARFDTESLEQALDAFAKNYPFEYDRINDQILIK